MEYLAVFIAIADNITDKLIKADIEKVTINTNADILQTKINANKDKYITGVAVTGAVIVTGMITSTICKIKGGQNNE